MIVFDLICDRQHRFEVWFRSSDDFVSQRDGGVLSCPICGTAQVDKAVMAPRLARKGNQCDASAGGAGHAHVEERDAVPAPSPETSGSTAKVPDNPLGEKAAQFLRAVRDHVEKNCDYVGPGFAEEARKIHYGETEERGIYGQASERDVSELLEEGIDILPLPVVRRTDN
ncbi:DUF1178 family protein [Eilatimonas milleporae]|uniref:DUF1178 family protein n=1 Tax=Eilatimonas milleporae TaxID=911205 RepID=A0A3M0C3Y3_9PROT|nr:DUF1178 family protein [Eilatimonas milleporae]RMB01526.1 hypothetical protein BXY39_3713 [Eilatimonas milleporae]